MPVPIKVPTLGESVTEAIIANWKFADGDYVQLDDVLVELETDKVSVEVAASQAGILSIGAKPGDTVAVGDPLGTIDETAKKPAGGKATSTSASTPTSTPATAPAAKASKTPTGESKAVNVPTLGESVTEATVANWKFADGDNVKVDDVLVELETDKVSVEVASPAMGVLSISVQPGTTVAVGGLLANVMVGASGNAPAEKAPAPQTAQASAPQTPAPQAPAPQPVQAPAQNQAAVKAGPAVRQAMRQQGIAPQNVSPSGLHGNILASDLQRSAVAVSPAFASSDSLAPRPEDEREERVKLSKLRQTIALRLKEAQSNAALLTTFNEVNLTKMIEIRKEHKDRFEKKHGVRLGFMSFFSKAAVIALKEFPATNAEIYGDEIIYKNYYDIGVAVGSKQGLVVPVIRNVDQLSFAQIEKQIYEFGTRAQAGALTMDEMRGGTFTITNGGVFGSLLSTPIVNPPQSAILGMHKIQKRPIVENDEIVIADVMYLAMTYDHRIIDGREAVSFLVRIKELLETPERLLLDI